MLSTSQPKPFLKWAGGKRKLLPHLTAGLPERIERYAEPFFGGGALFFALADRIEEAALSDINADLILTYQIVQVRLPELEEALEEHAARHSDESYYYEVRATEPIGAVERAARFIYLNRTCFNGLHRVNRAGRFNSPRGSYRNPKILDRQALRAAREALKRAHVFSRDFSAAVKATPESLIYCDPPYHRTWTGYASGGFGERDHERLRDHALGWRAKGARVLISNSDTPFTALLYRRRFDIRRFEAPRAIAAKASSRRPAAEILATAR